MSAKKAAEAKPILASARASAKNYASLAFGPDRMLSLNETAVLAGISRDTIRRRYSHLIHRLSPRRVGVRLKDALSIGGELT
jgi:hypothetical protein